MVKKLPISILLSLIWLTGNWALAQDDVTLRSGTDVSAMLEQQQPLRWVAGQVIVKFTTSTRDAGDERLDVMGFTDHVDTTSGGEYIYSLPADRMRALSATQAQDQAEAAVRQMRAEPDVEYAQLNYIMHIVREPNDPGFAQQWHYRNSGSGSDEAPGGINLPRAWDLSVGSPSSIIAVIDTGILPDHPDIDGSPNLLPGFDMITDTFTSNDGDGRDADATDPGDGVTAGQCGIGSRPSQDSWHGTHVAGTVGVGNTDNDEGVAGVNWNSRILPLRALGRCGGSIADINDAIRWSAGLAVPGAPSNPNPAKVINMSLGAGAPCSASPSTQSAINDAVAAGAVVVVAAGNEASDAAGSFPASCNNVVTVAASDYNGDLVSRYSNFGEVVDIMAPGGDVSADEDNDGNPDGVLSMVDGGYAFFNGTSMATPHVAGVAGLLLARDPTLSPQEIENILKDNALPRTGQQCPRPCGSGLLNANIALDDPEPEPPLRLGVTPTEFELDEGESAVLEVVVRQGNAAVAGQAVSFTSGDVTVATITPANAITDSNGRAAATVSAVNRGNSNLVVAIAGQSQATPVTVNIRVVPGIGLIALLLLALLTGVFGYRRLGGERNR
ncbi:MAG: S8 family serine peptidase [Gammaproteobacteria bacterium]|nr:S8 family serine peptidase [Gammaproteobacteria bacterium]